jgi:hypothetical protein
MVASKPLEAVPFVYFQFTSSSSRVANDHQSSSSKSRKRSGTEGSTRISSNPLFKRLLPYIAWQLVALLAVEATLAFAGLGEEELFKLDPEIGTVHMTNKSITWRKEGYARSYLHGNGLRESGVTVAKPAGVYRIVLLGDSQVEGIQVALEDTAGQLLEKRLTKMLGRPVQVLNFGVSGYSTVQEFLLMKREVFKYSPDMVLMGYDSRDMFENWSAPDTAISNLRPYALKLPKQPVLVDSGPVKAFMKSPRGKFLNSIAWLRANSRIWGLISPTKLKQAATTKCTRP